MRQIAADRAITSRKEDLLDRAGFARTLADAIRAWEGRESLVIGLFGPWGSGKTSLKNMIVEWLAELDGPPVIEFNPWQFSSQDTLLRNFLEDLGTQLGHKAGSITAETANRWKEWVAALTVAQTAVRSITRWIVFGSGFGALITLLLVLGFRGSFVSRVSTGVFIALIAILTILAFFTRLGGSIATYVAAKATRSREMASDVLKSHLAKQLSSDDVRLLIIIDDVDRLPADQIRLIFQVLKTCTDLPGLVYLVPAAGDVLAAAVKQTLPPDISNQAPQFLERIFQVRFDVPSVLASDLERVVADRLALLFRSRDLQRHLQTTRFRNLAAGPLMTYLGTLRDVYRFFPALEVHLGLFHHSDDSPPDVNPTDLVALELLRLFEPAIYEALPGLKPILVMGRALAFDLSDRPDAATKLAIEALIAKASKPPSAKEILLRVFPRLESVLGGVNYDSDFASRWTREFRACAEDYFNRYFTLGLRSEDIPLATLKRVLDPTASKDSIARIFKEPNVWRDFPAVLRRLETEIQTLQKVNPVEFIDALFDVWDEFPVGGRGDFFPPEVRAYRVACAVLQSTPFEDRGALIRRAIEQSNGTALPTYFLTTGKPDDAPNPDVQLVSPSDLANLQKLLAEKIAFQGKANRLPRTKALRWVLWFWMEFGDSDRAREWIGRFTAAKEGAFALLLAHVESSYAYSGSDRVSTENKGILISQMRKLVDLETLRERLGDAQGGTLTDEEREVVELFDRDRARNSGPESWRPDPAQDEWGLGFWSRGGRPD